MHGGKEHNTTCSTNLAGAAPWPDSYTWPKNHSNTPIGSRNDFFRMPSGKVYDAVGKRILAYASEDIHFSKPPLRLEGTKYPSEYPHISYLPGSTYPGQLGYGDSDLPRRYVKSTFDWAPMNPKMKPQRRLPMGQYGSYHKTDWDINMQPIPGSEVKHYKYPGQVDYYTSW